MKKRMAMLICLILVLTGCSKPAAPSAPAAAQTGSYQDITDNRGNVVGVACVHAANEITVQMAKQLLAAFVAEKKADQPLSISGCWQASLEI